MGMRTRYPVNACQRSGMTHCRSSRHSHGKPFLAGSRLRLAPCLLLYLLLQGCTPHLGDSEAALALEDLAAGAIPSRLATQTPEPVRETVSYLTSLGERQADLYQSPEGNLAGIVLVPGAAARGRHDPRVVSVARTLARLRFAVLVPDMPGVRQYRVRATDVLEVAEAFAWLLARPGLAPQGRVGMAGFSYGAGPVLIAAMQPGISAQVRFVMSVGGYYDLHNVITYFTTGYADTGAALAVEGAHQAGLRQPHPYSESVFIRSNLDLLERSVDRGFLRSYADYLVDSGADMDEPIPGTLAPDARAFYQLLINHDPAAVPRLIDRLPERIRHLIESINPAAHDLSQLQARLILLHGRSDNLIPYTESVALSQALPAGQAQLFLIDGLAHVDLRPKAHDIPQLIAAMETLLAERAGETAGPVQ
jgi:pimeloyl-ACP methyl ester carboxylesterase